MKTRIPIFLASVLIIVSISHSQFENFYENWRWAHFTTKTGLPSNTIDAIIEADDGIVWVSTTKGIAWYNGFRWIKAEIDSKTVSKRVTKISKGIGSNILVVLNEKLYYGNKSGFKQIKSEKISIEKVNSACVIDSNTIFITTLLQNAHLILYQNNGNIEIINKYSPGSIRKTNSDRILIGNADGLFEYRNKELWQIIPHGFIRSISENKNGYGVLSIDSPKDQIGIWEWGNGHIPMLSSTERLLPVRSIDISSKNLVIAAYETGDIRIRSNGKWKGLKPVPSQMIGLLSLNFDKNDDLWVGTENGLYYFRNTPKKWTWWKYELADPRNIIMEILQSSSGDVWIGNKEGLEIRYANGRISTIDKINNRTLGLITGIAEDKNRNIWISSGSSFEGAFRWDGKEWKHFGYPEGLKCPRIHKIRKDSQGNLWFLGLAVSGVFIDSLNRDPGVFMYDGKSFAQINSKQGLLNDRVYSFVETTNGSKWFGTKTGLSRKQNNVWKHWDKKDLHNLVSVYAIESDNESRLWFSTFSSTLGYIDRNDSIHWVWDWVTDSDYRQKIWDLKLDSSGVLWVATTKGLYSNNHGIWTSYDLDSEFGLKELRVVLPLKDKIYVGGHGIGVGVLNREKINIPIKVEINQPIIEREKVFINWTVDAYWCAIPSDDIEVRFRLDDNNWSEWNKSRDITYYLLESGNHAFYIQTKDNYGNIQNNHLGMEFSVPFPIYQDPIFSIPITILISIIIYLIVKNIRTIIYHKQLIQNQRTRISNDLHDEVGSNLGSISLISQRIGRNETLNQEIREELEIISTTSQQTTEFLRDIVWYINPRYDSFMNLEARLREITGRMLKDISVQIEMSNDVQHDEKYIESRRTIILMYKEILHNILKHASATKVEVRCDRKPNVFRLFVKDNGVGFNYSESLSGNGLASLKRRAEEAGADLKIKTQIGEGTEILITFSNNINTI